MRTSSLVVPLVLAAAVMGTVFALLRIRTGTLTASQMFRYCVIISEPVSTPMSGMPSRLPASKEW